MIAGKNKAGDQIQIALSIKNQKLRAKSQKLKAKG
jgi:hypothetical protein